MTRKHILPAGTYFIGDPCYIIRDDDDWEKIGNATNWFGCDDDIAFPDPPKDWDDGLYHWNGNPCFASHTRYGDGVYVISKGKREIWVDSGTIGVTFFDGNPPKNGGRGFWMGGIIEEHKNPFEVWEENGVFHIGKSIIHTE
jgi:hypothetical protein